MSHTTAAAKVRQLCALQIAPTQLLPAVLRSLHEVVPADLNVFAWAAADGNPEMFFAEFPTPPALMAHYEAEFLGRPNAEVGPSFQAVVRQPGFQDTGMEYGTAFRSSGFYEAIFWPLRLDNALRVSVGNAQGGVGVLTLDRSRATRDFTASERRRIVELVPHLAHALRRTAAPVGHWMPTADEGMLILDRNQQLQAVSAGAEHLLQLACARQRREDLLIHLAQLASLLRGTLSGINCRPAVHTLSNPWGRFEFRAYPLSTDPQFDTAPSLLGISVRRWQPLQLGVTANAQMHGLSARQAQLCVLAAEGKTYAEMGAALGIAPSTAIGYMRVIYDKLGVSDRAALCQRLAGPEIQAGTAF